MLEYDGAGNLRDVAAMGWEFDQDSQLFRQPHFGFLEDLFEAAKTGKWEAIHRNGADFTHRLFFQRRATAFFVDENEHQASRLPKAPHFMANAGMLVRIGTNQYPGT